MISLSLLGSWALQTMVAFFATVAFAIIFHTPRREYLWAGLTGGTGWLVFQVSAFLGCGVVSASFFATVALTWMARSLSFLRRTPVTVYLICGIFPLVPGAGIYYTGYYFFTANNTLGMLKGLETIKIAIVIALGIGIVLSLPPVLFLRKRAPKMPHTNLKQGDPHAAQEPGHP